MLDQWWVVDDPALTVMLGRKISERPTELTCALTLAAALGPTVLVGEHE